MCALVHVCVNSALCCQPRFYILMLCATLGYTLASTRLLTCIYSGISLYLYSGHHWNPAGCPVRCLLFRGRFVHSRVGTADSVLNREVSFIQSVLYRQVPLYPSALLCRLSWTRLQKSSATPTRTARSSSTSGKAPLFR